MWEFAWWMRIICIFKSYNWHLLTGRQQYALRSGYYKKGLCCCCGKSKFISVRKMPQCTHIVLGLKLSAHIPLLLIMTLGKTPIHLCIAHNITEGMKSKCIAWHPPPPPTRGLELVYWRSSIEDYPLSVVCVKIMDLYGSECMYASPQKEITECK